MCRDDDEIIGDEKIINDEEIIGVDYEQNKASQGDKNQGNFIMKASKNNLLMNLTKH